MVVKSQAETWVSLAINEIDINEVKPDQKAIVIVDALSDKRYESEVRRVDAVGTVESGVVTFMVYLTIDEVGLKIKPGMTAQVEIITDERKDVLIVANEAIKPYQGGKAVQVVGQSGSLIYKPVEVGVRGVTVTEIISGLELDEEIIVNQNGGEKKSGGFNPLGH